MELDSLTMGPIAETSIAVIEESTQHSTHELLEMMIKEASGGSSDSDNSRSHDDDDHDDHDDDDASAMITDEDSGILDRATCMMSLDDDDGDDDGDDEREDHVTTSNTRRVVVQRNTYLTKQNSKLNFTSTASNNLQPLLPPLPTTTQAAPTVIVAVTPQHKRNNNNYEYDNPDATVVSPLTITALASNSNPNDLPPSPSSPPSSSGASTSPTSVMTTPVGMVSLCDMSSIVGANTTVNGVGDTVDDLIVSPSSTHIDFATNNGQQQQQCRHTKQQPKTMESDTNKENDDHLIQMIDQDQEHEVVPTDLLGRLQQQPRGDQHANNIPLVSPAISPNTPSRLSSSHYFRTYDNDEPENEGLISKRLQEIELKKVALHQKRISLEQRLYDFVDSEKRMRVRITAGNHNNNSPNHHNSNNHMSMGSLNRSNISGSGGSLMNQSLQSTRSLLRPPMPSPNKGMSPRQQQQQSLMNIHQNGDEMVQDYPWKDPRNKNDLEIAYFYSGALNKLKQPHGVGLMKFLDGQEYEGQCYTGYRWGMGTNKWPDGQVYVGEWDDHSRNGRGTHTWKDGRRATGQWSGGHLNGRVIFTWPNGASFDGECRMGKKHGRGTHTWANGRLFSGSFVNGKESGFGSLTQSDWRYRGNFENGKRSGIGMQIWSNKTYDGEWTNNKAHGKGRIVWQNGSTYTGDFKCGKYHGLGVYIWPNGKKYVGCWENGAKHGQGVYTFPSGKKYDGAYEKGVKAGYGRMSWPDGRMYCGSWSKGRREGRGIQTNADGSMEHCGLWKKDKPYIKGVTPSPAPSVCTLSLASGSRHQGRCQNTSEEDIVYMESHSVAVADESYNIGRKCPKAAASVAPKEPVDLPVHSKSMAPSIDLKTIPGTPSKMDDMSSIGTCDQDRDVSSEFLLSSTERLEL